MKDVNYPLRKAYFAALQAVGLPVYYQSLPNNLHPENYIIFRGITSNDASTKNSSDTSTSMVVEIHTLKDITNPGLDADNIANSVFNYIYNISQFVLPMYQMQMVSTQMQFDRVDNIQLNHQQAYVSRFITFQHDIFVSSYSGGGTVISDIPAIGNYRYTATQGQTSLNVPSLANKKILLFSKDGVVFTQTTGNPVDKKYTYSGSVFTWSIPAEAGEEIYIVYQNL